MGTILIGTINNTSARNKTFQPESTLQFFPIFNNCGDSYVTSEEQILKVRALGLEQSVELTLSEQSWPCFAAMFFLYSWVRGYSMLWWGWIDGIRFFSSWSAVIATKFSILSS